MQMLEAITRQGVLYAASVRYWRGCKQLKPEDLGIDPAHVDERLIRLGHKRLVPKEALAPFALIEGRVHAAIEAASFPFLGGIARFVPNTRLEEVTIVLKGPYDIAVDPSEAKDGTYGFTTDWWQGHVAREVGENYGRLLQSYGVNKTMREARARGLRTHRRVEQDGSILLTLEGGRL